MSRTPLPALVAFGLLALGACSGPEPAPAPGGLPTVFTTQPDFRPGGVAPPCLVHQTQPPNGLYMPGPDERTDAVLTLLGYYSAVGNATFCDGAGATDLDRSWARLYVQFTGNSDGVTSLL